MSGTPMDKFLHRHHIQIADNSKRWHRAKPLKAYFTSPDDYNSVIENLQYETEKLYTIQIPESELTRIAEFEEQVFNNMAQPGHFNMFEMLMEQKEKERYLKDTYPAVKKAYEQYSLILKMAQSGEL
jgi:hypothetical protein